jgi:hypothetical protein
MARLWSGEISMARSRSLPPERRPEEQRHPVLLLEKGELWAETHGERGIDPQIMYERALIEALRLELSRAEDDGERASIEESLRRAVMEERISQQMRREAAEAAAAGVM